jgi:S1-C subfamily serine protease
MRARISGAICALAVLVPPPASAQPAGSPWRIVAEEGLCSALYSLDGVTAQGFTWAPDGSLAWHLLRRNGADAPLRLQVETAIGESYAGTAEPDDDKEFRSYIYVDGDRRNARLILSGDITFRYQIGGRRIEATIPAGVQAPRIASCMAQAREQAARGHTGTAVPGGRAPPKDGDMRIVSTGSGVFIDDKGTLITNAHVVDGCKAVGSEALGPGELLAVDAASDLALLRFRDRTGPYARLRESGVKLGEPVTAAGYPLQNILANGLNVTVGNVSALAGIGGDRRMLQISAPVQPGNSGGALLDANGRLVGVVVARLNREAGDPQNINFAVAPYVVGAFLRENGVEVGEPAPPVKDVAQLARQFTVQLKCAA